jgi:hypothetical protein
MARCARSPRRLPGGSLRPTHPRGGAGRLVLGVRGLLLASLVLLASAADGRAASWTIAGLTFSDELGGVRLIGVAGRGTPADPLVLVEEITGAGPAVLMVTNHRNGGELISPARGFLALTLVKIVINRGPWSWSGFDLELRTTPDQASVYSDGLSFDQPQTFRRLARADRFAQTVQEDEPFDRIRFDGGSVHPRRYLRLAFDVIDANGRPVFYLVQRPIVLLAWQELLPLPQLAALEDTGLAAR